LNCFSVSTGEQLSQQTLAYLPHPDDIRAGGLLIGVPEGDNPYLFASRRVLYDLQTGKKITGWTLQTQRLLPKPFSRVGFYPFDIAPDGKVVAEGGEGVVTLYQLP
jgi:hypothetical protein